MADETQDPAAPVRGDRAANVPVGPRAASEDDYRELLEQAADAIFIFREDGRFLRTNARACALTGYDRDTLQTMRIHDLVVPEDVPELAERIATLADGPRTRERLIRGADGRTIPVEVSATALSGGRAQVIMRDITERKRAEQVLRESDERFRLVARATNDAVWDWNLATDTLWWSEAITALSGHSLAAIEPHIRWWTAQIHEADRERVVASIYAALAGNAATWDGEYRFCRADGSVALVFDRGFIIRDAAGRATRMLGSMQDITERTRTAAALHASEASLAESQRIAHLGSWEYDYTTGALSWSDELFRIAGYQPQAFVPDAARIRALVHPEDREWVDRIFRMRDLDGGPSDVDFRLIRADGAVRLIHQQAESQLSADGRPLRRIGIMHDVTAQRRLEAQLQHQAFHDTLTDLPNRALFLDRLGQALARARRAGPTAAILFLDLDRFKDVNDSLGHAAGDQLLVAVAGRLRRALREDDTLARFGGDEFAVLLEGLDSEAEALRVAERLGEALAQPFRIGATEQLVTASIGIVPRIAPGARAEDLLRDADVAMYQAKEAGRAGAVIFDPAMQTEVVARLELERDLRVALERGEFTLHFQPIVDVSTWRIVAAEALLRWHHPQRGPISPDDFIPLAEQSGLIRPLGRWVLQEACRQARGWALGPLRQPIGVAVNLSAREFGGRQVVEDVADALHASGLSPQLLCLEITESAAMDDAERALPILRTLKGLGVRLAIDDFGTGYSSLAYLQRFPVDALKIDRSFIRDLGYDPTSVKICRAIATLAKTLQIEIVAEGIETALQADLARGFLCDRAQGYFFSRPLPAEAFAALLATDPHFAPAPAQPVRRSREGRQAFAEGHPR